MIIEFTQDTLFDGDIVLNQYKNGYRFSVDSVLVSQYVKPKKNFRILDLGCGSGVIGLICLYRWRSKLDITVTGIELQQDLYQLCLQNIEENKLDQAFNVIHCDIRDISTTLNVETFDMVICNPPFFKKGSGRTSQNDQAHIARHQVNGAIDEFLKGAAKLLKNKSFAVFIYPASELADFIEKAKNNKLEPKQIQPIYNYPEGDNEARLMLVKCQKNGGVGVKFERPFYIYQEKNGDYHKQMKQLYMPNENKDLL